MMTGTPRERLLEHINNLSDEQVANLLFSLRWGYLSLDDVEKHRKKLSANYHQFLDNSQIDYIVDLSSLNEDQQKKYYAYSERIEFCHFLERECKKNKII